MNDRAAPSTISAAAWAGLGVLIVFNMLSFIDKQMFALLLTQIQDTLQFSDTRMGVLQGLAFGVTYALATMLAGWAVDRYSVRAIIFIGVIVWSLASVASGLAGSFGQMFAARAGVGLGEAVFWPTALSLIARLFARDRIAFATGILNVGANAGAVVALLFGGAMIGALVAHGGLDAPVLGHLAPWQAAFILAGSPGLLIAFLVFAIPPSRKAARGTRGGGGVDAASWSAFGAFLVRRWRIVGCQVFTCGFLGALSYSLISWSPAFLQRAHHWTPSRIGAGLAFGAACGGAANVFWGWLADVFRRRGHADSLYRVFIATQLVGIPITATAFMLTRGPLMLVFYALTWAVAMSWGALNSTPASIALPGMAGKLVALQTAVVGIMGLGFAPILVGAITDHVFADRGQVGASVTLAMAISASMAVMLMLLGLRPLREAVAEADAASVR